METVNVNRIQVYPCAYWKGLIRRANTHQGNTSTGFDKGTWPPKSSILCWQCCHSFDYVPAYYPVDLDVDRNIFYFMGNFCSWNCVKGYGVRMKDHQRPQGASYISLLAFLTVHRPKYCLEDAPNKHSSNCPCIDMFRGVQLPGKKELLRAFGGCMDVGEYRKDFLKIESYDWVNDYFSNNNSVKRDMNIITSNVSRRAYTFCFLSYPGPAEATVEHLYVLPLTHKTLPKTQSETPTESNVPRKSVKPCTRSNPGGRRRFPRNNSPAPTSTSVVDAPQPRVTVEPAVSEEQAFYISSVHKYGNLFSSMGITIEKKP